MQVVENSAAFFFRQGVVAAVSETRLGRLDVATAFLGKGCYRVRVVTARPTPVMTGARRVPLLRIYLPSLPSLFLSCTY